MFEYRRDFNHIRQVAPRARVAQSNIQVLSSNQVFPFSALTLLVGRQEEHPVCKGWVLVCCGDDLTARLRAPAVITSSIILSCNKTD